MASLTVNVQIEPWFSELVEALKDLVDRCKSAGVPVEVMKEHVDSMVEDAAKRAVSIG